MKKNSAILLSLIICLLFTLPAAAEETNDYTVGSMVTFGIYEQDNNKDNGEEAIEWLVLAVEDDQVLLISRYCLDAKPYNIYEKRITWGRSSLRIWLNYNFLKAAFTNREREEIVSTTVVNADSTVYDSYGGNDTTDQVFLLSYEEVLQYFPEQEDRLAQATPYAVANGAFVDETTGYTWWWLRSPGADNRNASGVRSDGRVTGYGSREVNRTSGTIRPVIWLYIGE